MAKYKTKFVLPEEFRAFVEIIQSYAEIETADIHAEQWTIIFESDDEYELATVVHDLNDELRSAAYMLTAIERPTLVTEPTTEEVADELREEA
jgi:hypothetical protein